MPRKDYAAQLEYNREWARKNYAKKAAAREQVAENQKTRRANRREYLAERLGDCCVKCGCKDNLEYDHINPGLKQSNTSILAIGADKLESEIANTQVLCKDCHKERSRLQRRAAYKHFFSLPLEQQEELMGEVKGCTGFTPRLVVE